jgi:hypothetical protein
VGWLLGLAIAAASVQDRDGAKPLLRRAKVALGRLSKVWADFGFTPASSSIWVKQLRPHGQLHLKVVRSPKPTQGFAVQPGRWVIELMLRLADQVPARGLK